MSRALTEHGPSYWRCGDPGRGLTSTSNVFLGAYSGNRYRPLGFTEFLRGSSALQCAPAMLHYTLFW